MTVAALMIPPQLNTSLRLDGPLENLGHGEVNKNFTFTLQQAALGDSEEVSHHHVPPFLQRIQRFLV